MIHSSVRRGLLSCTSKLNAAFSAQKVADESYNRFRSAYVKQLSKFTEVMDNKTTVTEDKKKPRKAFSHPFQSEFSPISLTGYEAMFALNDLMGPEQVSPHYENFLMTRKYAFGFWGGMIALGYFANTFDFHVYASSFALPFAFYYLSFYWVLEGKKHVFLPFLNTFYTEIISHEIRLMASNFNDNMREVIDEKLKIAREQLEYYEVHRDYDSVKADSVNRFLANEQINLKNHIYNRTSAILRTAGQIEQANQRSVISNIVQGALKEVDITINQNLDDLQPGMFESALTGIKNKRMTYENDPLLPLVQNTIRNRISNLKNLSAEEQLKLVQLTSDQIGGLRTLDNQMKDEYLRNAPKLDNSLKNHEYVKNALQNWGK